MALATHVPASWDTVLSTTMHNYRKTLTDNIFNSRPLLNYLMEGGRVKTADGGYSIIEPLLLGPGDADSYSQWQTIAVNAVNGISAAQYPWKQLYATIVISGLEEAQNNGKEQVINLVEAKVMQAEETLKSILSRMLWGTRGASAHVDTDFTPFTSLIDATAPAGGITPAAAPAIENQWRSTTIDAAAGTGIDSTGAPVTGLPAGGALDGAGLEKLLRRTYMLASDGGSDKPDAIFTGAEMFEAYEASLTPQVRYTDTSKANLGFQNLMFKNIPLYYDPDAPAGTALFLNNKYIGLTIHSDRNFKQTPFSQNLGMDTATANGRTAGAAPTSAAVPTGFALDARVSYITTYGNTTVRNRRRLAKITGMTFACHSWMGPSAIALGPTSTAGGHMPFEPIVVATAHSNPNVKPLHSAWGDKVTATMPAEGAGSNVQRASLYSTAPYIDPLLQQAARKQKEQEQEERLEIGRSNVKIENRTFCSKEGCRAPARKGTDRCRWHPEEIV